MINTSSGVTKLSQSTSTYGGGFLFVPIGGSGLEFDSRILGELISLITNKTSSGVTVCSSSPLTFRGWRTLLQSEANICRLSSDSMPFQSIRRNLSRRSIRLPKNEFFRRRNIVIVRSGLRINQKDQRHLVDIEFCRKWGLLTCNMREIY